MATLSLWTAWLQYATAYLTIVGMFIAELLATLAIFWILEAPARDRGFSEPMPKKAELSVDNSAGASEPIAWMFTVRKEALASGDIYLTDMLCGVVLLASTEDEDVNLTKLVDYVSDFLQGCGLVQLDTDQKEAMHHVVTRYCPWETGAHLRLLGQLEEILTAGDEWATHGTALPSLLREPSDHTFFHPMRGIPLGNCLSSTLWLEAHFQDDNTKERQAADWALSQDMDICDYFCSHAWADEKVYPRAKVSLMRNFLFMDYMNATLVVSCGMVIAYLASLGTGIATVVPAFPWYSPSVAVLGGLTLVYLWIVLSTYGVVPSRYAPWALSPTTLWLDKSCILQESPETISAGVTSFQRFLGQCRGMIAFVSPVYFSRLWCVYGEFPLHTMG